MMPRLNLKAFFYAGLSVLIWLAHTHYEIAGVIVLWTWAPACLIWLAVKLFHRRSNRPETSPSSRPAKLTVRVNGVEHQFAADGPVHVRVAADGQVVVSQLGRPDAVS